MGDTTFVIGCGILGFLVYVLSPVVFRAIMSTEGEEHKKYRLRWGKYYDPFVYNDEPKWTE
jgi:hypothetical protein